MEIEEDTLPVERGREPGPPDRETGRNSDAGFARRICLLWLAIVSGLLLSHEMWRDEFQAWLIARDSRSVVELIRNLRYEGTPGLWPILVFLVARMTSWPGAMQFLHLVVAGTTVCLLVSYGPFGRRLNVALSFGYFFLYEYAVISRNYALEVLGVILFCLAYHRAGRHRLLWASGALALIALTSAYGVILAAALLAAMTVDMVRAGRPSRRQATVAGVVVATAIGFAALSLRQPADASFRIVPTLAWNDDRFAQALAGVWRGFVPLPMVQADFWNSNILDALPMLPVVGGLLILPFCAWSLRRSPAALTALAAGSAGLFLFAYFVFVGGVRHYGHYFLVFVAACWMAAASAPPRSFRPWRHVLMALAVIHIAAGAYAAVMDAALPFSGSRAAAAYISNTWPDDVPIVVDPELNGTAFAALIRRQVYFAQSDRWGSFVTGHAPAALWARAGGGRRGPPVNDARKGRAPDSRLRCDPPVPLPAGRTLRRETDSQ